MIRRPPRSTLSSSSAASDVYKRQVMSGMELPLAVMIAIPEPWVNNNEMSQNKKDFYQYYATMMEPWDGPASILFSDGDVMGAVLDRNGLRPSRYYITEDLSLIHISEPTRRTPISYAVFCLKKKKNKNKVATHAII